MSKPKVVIIGVADWAGSAHQVHRAINHLGDFDCRHINLFRHPFEYPTDLFMPIYPNSGSEQLVEPIRAVKDKQYSSICDVLRDAGLIHLWNTYPGESGLMAVGLPIDFSKVKVVTMTGSLYRGNHQAINQQLCELKDCKITAQNPLLRFPDEIESVFIPHAVDIEALVPQNNRENKIGTYRPNYTSNIRHAAKDIAKLYELIKEHPDWHIDLDYSMPHKERMEKLAQCSIFVQDLSPDIGYWGRSTLEACALGVPTLQNYSDKVLQYSSGKLGDDIPIVRTTWDEVKKDLSELVKSPDARKTIGLWSRRWVEKHFSYPVVGKMYSDIYNEI